MLEMMTGSFIKKITEPGLEIDPEVFQKLVASDESGGDLFGYSVSISGDSSTIVVGAHNDGDKGPKSGSVYVFTKQANGTYLQSQKVVAADGGGNNFFGYSVAISQTSIIVGAYNPFNKGAVYVY